MVVVVVVVMVVVTVVIVFIIFVISKINPFLSSSSYTNIQDKMYSTWHLTTSFLFPSPYSHLNHHKSALSFVFLNIYPTPFLYMRRIKERVKCKNLRRCG